MFMARIFYYPKFQRRYFYVRTKKIDEYFDSQKLIGEECMKVVSWLIDKTIEPDPFDMHEDLCFNYMHKLNYPEGDYAYVNCVGIEEEEYIFPLSYLHSDEWKKSIIEKLEPGQYLNWHPSYFNEKQGHQFAGYPHGASDMEIKDYWLTVHQSYAKNQIPLFNGGN